MKNSNFYTFASLFFVLIIDTMSFGIVMPILPNLFLNPEVALISSASMKLQDFYYGLTMAIFFIFIFLGAPFWGDLSDQLGRKKVLTICLLGVALGYLISGVGILLKNILFLILGRAINGFAAGSQSIAQAAIIDRSCEERKIINIGFITLASGIGFIIGPIVGGYFSSLFPLSPMSSSLPFFIATTLAIINALGLYLTFTETVIKETKPKLNLTKSLTSLRNSFKLKKLRMISLIYFCMQFSWGIYFQFIALYLAKIYHYSSNQIGLFMTYLGILFSLSLLLIMRVLLLFMKNFALIIVGFILVIIGFLLTVFYSSEGSLWINVLPISIGMALSYASLTVLFSNRVGKDFQGMVMGILGSLGSLSWFISGLSLGILTIYSMNFPFIIALSTMITSLILLIFESRS